VVQVHGKKSETGQLRSWEVQEYPASLPAPLWHSLAWLGSRGWIISRTHGVGRAGVNWGPCGPWFVNRGGYTGGDRTRSPEWRSGCLGAGPIGEHLRSSPGPRDASQNLQYCSRRWLEELNNRIFFPSFTKHGRDEALTRCDPMHCVLFLQTCMTKCSSSVPTLWTA